MRLQMLAILVVALFSATGHWSHAAENGKGCDLVTKEEVEKITGERIDKVEVQSGYGNCLYHRNVNIFGQMVQAPLVTVGYTQSDVLARWNYWNSRPDKEVVPGLGDGAVWSPGDAFLVCRIKGGLLMISVWGSDEKSKKKRIAVSLAKIAVPRVRP